MNKKLTTKQKQ